MTIFDAWMFGDLFAWSDAIEATRAIPYQWYPTETMHEWAGAVATVGATKVKAVTLLWDGMTDGYLAAAEVVS